MAVCLECKADYIRGITVCPACGLALEADPVPEVEAPSADFVELMGAEYGKGMAAAASLEAAGLETRITTMNPNIYMPAPLTVTVHVRERDLDAACAVLRLPRPKRPQGPVCTTCGAPATVYETARRHGTVGTLSYCPVHASHPVTDAACTAAPEIDEDIAKVVQALKDKKGVRSVCSCSGSHAGAGVGFISLAPTEGAESIPLFDAFVERLQDHIRESDLAGRVEAQWSAEHGAEITLLDRAHARDTWNALARLLGGF